MGEAILLPDDNISVSVGTLCLPHTETQPLVKRLVSSVVNKFPFPGCHSCNRCLYVGGSIGCERVHEGRCTCRECEITVVCDIPPPGHSPGHLGVSARGAPHTRDRRAGRQKAENQNLLQSALKGTCLPSVSDKEITLSLIWPKKPRWRGTYWEEATKPERSEG